MSKLRKWDSKRIIELRDKYSNRIRSFFLWSAIFVWVLWLVGFFFFSSPSLHSIVQWVFALLGSVRPESLDYYFTDQVVHYSILASFLSFGLLLPILLWQILSQKEQTKENYDALEAQLKQLHNIGTEEGLKKLSEWVNPTTKNHAPELIYLSKHSAIPGFWLEGDTWIQNNLVNRKKIHGEKLLFAGPAPNSTHFIAIADKVLAIVKEPNHPKYNDVRSIFGQTPTRTSIETKYTDTVDSLISSGGTVISLDDDGIKSIGLNFVLNKAQDRLGNMGSPWEIMFFDSGHILSGENQSSGFNPREVFDAPNIFSASNEALGNMFNHFARQVHDDLKI